jgi:hypothetical protein
MQIETLASKGSNYYEDQKKEDKYNNNLPEMEEIDNLNSYERLEQCKFIGFNNIVMSRDRLRVV